MDLSTIHLHLFFGWLGRATVQAGVLVCLILLAQKGLGRWIGVRGRHCLWFLLLIRLALPWTPHSGLSVFNLLPIPSFHSAVTHIGRGADAVSDGVRETSTTQTAGVAGASGTSGLETQTGQPGLGDIHGLGARVTFWLPLFWLIGAVGLAGCIVVNHLRLIRIVRSGRPVTDGWILEVLEECRRLMGTKGAVEAIETDAVPCPALCGFWRPRLLLPRETLVGGDRNELRHIFLHELAHLKRHDILVGYAASLLYLFHWFNPLVVFGLRCMRADRELVCDGLALSRLHPDEAPAYGHTVVRQVERLLGAPRQPLLTGLGGERAHVRQRIAMISRFRDQAHHRSRLTVVLVVCLASLGLTDGLTADGPGRRDTGAASPISFADRHANIIRVYIHHRGTGKYLAVQGDGVVCDAEAPGQAGLWEARFDEDLGNPDHRVYFYSVAARKYLVVDEQGHLALDGSGPDDAGRWVVWSRSVGVWLISEAFQNGYLRLGDQGEVRAEHSGRDERSYWDIYQIWRVKVSEDPVSNPQWRREHVPGPDR